MAALQPVEQRRAGCLDSVEIVAQAGGSGPERLLDLGVDGLITDYPDVAVSLFGSGTSTPSMR